MIEIDLTDKVKSTGHKEGIDYLIKHYSDVNCKLVEDCIAQEKLLIVLYNHQLNASLKQKHVSTDEVLADMEARGIPRDSEFVGVTVSPESFEAFYERMKEGLENTEPWWPPAGYKRGKL